MKILFVYIGCENLGIEYLGACARAAGHEVGLAFDPSVFGGHQMWDFPGLGKLFDRSGKIVDRVAREKPDVVAFSCLSINYQWSLDIARRVKEVAPTTCAVFGGMHVTAVPYRVIEESAVDALITGEADETFPAFLSDLENGRVEPRPGVWRKIDGEVVAGGHAPPVRDPGSLPFPAKDMFHEKSNAFRKTYTIMAGRGCPYSCTYCYKGIESLKSDGPSVRRRSVENVIGELESALACHRPGVVFFRDDIFTLNSSWLEKFARAYSEKIAIPYFCYTYPLNFDEKRADMLKESGCSFVTVGVQSLDEEQRRRVLNRNYSNEQVFRTVALLKERGIRVSIDHILGIPGDTREKIAEAVRLYCIMKPDRLLTYWLTYFPGTILLERAVADGSISEKTRERIEQGYVGTMYGGTVGTRSDLGLKAFFPVFSLIPLTPAKFVRFVRGNRFLMRLLKPSFVNNFLLAVNALRIRDPFFIFNLLFILSRKKAP